MMARSAMMNLPMRNLPVLVVDLTATLTLPGGVMALLAVVIALTAAATTVLAVALPAAMVILVALPLQVTAPLNTLLYRTVS